MSLLFNMLSRLVIAFLSRSKHLLISWLQSPSAVILEPRKIKSDCFPIYLPWSDGTGCHDLHFFWMLSFKLAFSLSTFTFIKRFFSSSSFSAIRVVSSAYLWWIVFLPAILIPAWDSSSLAFCMMYSAQKLNMQGDTIQLWCTLPNLEPVHCSMSSSNCCFLTCKLVSQEAGKGVWYSHLFRNFDSLLWSTHFCLLAHILYRRDREVQTHHDWEPRRWLGCVLIWGLYWGRVHFWARSGCWLNSAPCGCRLRPLLSHWLRARSSSWRQTTPFPRGAFQRIWNSSRAPVLSLMSLASRNFRVMWPGQVHTLVSPS